MGQSIISHRQGGKVPAGSEFTFGSLFAGI